MSHHRPTAQGESSAWPVCPLTGKFTYPNRHKAHGAVRRAGYRVRTYRCDETDGCGGWHNTRADAKRSW